MKRVFSYTGKKGNLVEVTPTCHSLQRFGQRWWELYNENIEYGKLAHTMCEEFNKAKRVTRKNAYQVNKKYKNSVYLETRDFVFVVCDLSIITTLNRIRKQKRRW